jgi:hypothetical protein
VSEPTPLLGREGIEEAFRRLGDRLAKRGVVADVYVFGGAAGADYTADWAAWDMSPGSSADARSGAAFPASREVSSGAAGMWARTGGLAVVQRCAHDMASLQYQRMSAHA